MVAAAVMDHPPLVIGGTGGSGTRLLAQLCMDAGYRLAGTLNESLDTLEWFDFYEQWITPALRESLGSGAQERLRIELRRLITGLRDTVPDRQRARWGWKTPRSLLLLHLLNQWVPELRFLHLVRDGRDMAYSSNQNQWLKHGSALLTPEQQQLSPPLQSILFWQLTNLRALETGNTMGHRYLWLRYEDLVAGEAQVFQSLGDFLGRDPAEAPRSSGSVRTIGGIGRWRNAPSSEIQVMTELARDGLIRFGYMR